MSTQQTAETIVGAVDDLEYTVLARTSHTPNIIELELAPADERLSYRSGQYVLIGDPDHTLPVRSYSLANAPNPSGRISVLVTEVPGGEMSTWLHRGLRIGDRVLVSGPYGTFVADPGADGPVLRLAAGSGLAPIRALAEDAVRRAGAQRFTVLFSARTQADVMDMDRFASWQQQYPGLRFVRTLTGQAGEPPLGRLPGCCRRCSGTCAATRCSSPGLLVSSPTAPGLPAGSAPSQGTCTPRSSSTNRGRGALRSQPRCSSERTGEHDLHQDR